MITALPACGAAHPANSPGPLALERTISLPGVAGRIDHLAVDLTHHRVFVAELGNGSFDVVNWDSGKSRRIEGLREPQGIGYLSSRNEIVVASGGDGTVRFYDGETLKQTGLVALGADADNVHVDLPSNRVVVGYGSGALAFIDPVRRAVVRTIRLGAHPEGIGLDPRTGRVFSNLPSASSIAVADEASGKVIAQWKAPHAFNFPMALDAEGEELAVAFRRPARLVLADTWSGKVRKDLPTCGDADDLFFDARRHRLYVSCGSGQLDVFEKRANDYVHVAEVPTARGARTSLFVSETDRLLVAAPSGWLGQPARLMIFRPER